MNDLPASRPSPAVPIGSQMVIELIGTPPRQLARLHASDRAEDTVAQLVVTGARHLDYLHEQLASQAQQAADNLTRVATGKAHINSLGVLQNSATQIDILASRRADAMEHLKEMIHAYRQLTTHTGASPEHALQRGATPARGAPTPPPSAHPSARRNRP
ncbi:hypothetical protein G4Z16_00850 [Streptomyces bathyalis]|uniref:Uncharacterized protein n=1 Tax=Streptomyces bathyalis TaxID=2710756 RepID=A0A7T1T2G0_9ACTN|nr:hypothetical protein [Streptomyces bathyalis]QPP05175.1 hypothetical protein G4Z16_00850 [Streptomyces bathyalis]